MTGSAPAQEDDPGAAELGARLKAWFSALAGRPVPARLRKHLDALDGGAAETPKP